MNLKHVFVGFLLYLYYQDVTCKTESVTFFSIERPVVNWYDTKFFKNFTLISRRVSRQDPRHYVELYVHPLITVTNDLKLDFYFYQFLTNRYRPSFVEMHFGFCDMWQSDKVFGQTMRVASRGINCPIPPGEYHLYNMSMSSVPKGFPFLKGRIYCNVSLSNGSVTKHIARGSIDMEIKVTKVIKTRK